MKKLGMEAQVRYHRPNLLRAFSTILANLKRSPRAAFLALAKVHDLTSKSDIGYIGNISTGGFMLFANQPLPYQSRRLISVDLPHPEHGSVSVQMGVRIVWQIKDMQKPRQQSTGCEILAIEPADRLALLQSAKAYGMAA